MTRNPIIVVTALAALVAIVAMAVTAIRKPACGDIFNPSEIEWSTTCAFDGASWVVVGALDTSAHTWTPYRQGTVLGTASTATTGASGHVLGFLDGANTYSDIQSGATAAINTSTTQFATTAFVIGQAASATPLVDGTAAAGSSTRYARADHVHPTDTTRAPLASPALTGTPTAPTASPGTNSTQVATTAYADAIAALKANLASPTFTGTPAAPTAAVDTNTTQLADTAFVIGQAAGATPLIDGTAAVGSSTRYARADHVHPTDTTRAPLASPALTGTPTAPTASPGANSTQLATTAYADAIASLKANASRNISTGCGLAGGGDLSADRTLRVSLTINSQIGTSYTVVDGDCGKLVTFNNAAPVAVTLPQANGSTFVSGWPVDFQNKGAGTVTVTPVTSTINGGTSLALTQNQGMHCASDGTN